VPTFTVVTEINASPADVFAYVADLTRHHEWAADPLEIVLVDGDGGPHSRYTSTAKSKGKTITAEITVTAVDPPRRFAFDVTDLTGRYEHVFNVAAAGGGSTVERRVTAFSLSPAQRALFYLVYPTVKRPNARRALARLQAQFDKPG
jgi:uncharacterized protein YndB with AHSA1/START domain